MTNEGAIDFFFCLCLKPSQDLFADQSIHVSRKCIDIFASEKKENRSQKQDKLSTFM